TMNTAKGVTATFGDGHVVTLSVEGDGLLHFEDGGVPYTDSEPGGPVIVGVHPESRNRALSAEPDTGGPAFWRWSSDAPTFDGYPLPEGEFQIGQHTAITAAFAPAGTIDYISVTVHPAVGGGSLPPPGTYQIPRYASADLACVE